MPSHRFVVIQADICGPFSPSHGRFFLLVCIDRFTRSVEAYPMHDQSTQSVITAFCQHVQTSEVCSFHMNSESQFTSPNF